MPKAVTETKIKKASKATNAKTAKPSKEVKVKRPPSAYNQFMKDRLSAWKAEHPGTSHKEAFTAVAALWKDAPENPKRGEATVSRPEKGSEDKENAPSKPRSRGKKDAEVVQQSEEELLQMDSDE